MAVFQTAYDYDYTKFPGAENTQESLTETDGYTSTENLVEEIILAGERLQEWREDQYDYSGQDGENLEDGYIDRTRRGDYDLSDASADIEKIRGSVARQWEAMQAREAEKLKQNGEGGTDVKTATNTDVKAPAGD